MNPSLQCCGPSGKSIAHLGAERNELQVRVYGTETSMVGMVYPGLFLDISNMIELGHGIRNQRSHRSTL